MQSMIYVSSRIFVLVCCLVVTRCVPSTYVCILSGFHITYPAKHGEKLTWGEMGYLSWEVDTAMEKSPDLITRLRLVDDIGRNTQLIGENISKPDTPRRGSRGSHRVIYNSYSHGRQQRCSCLSGQCALRARSPKLPYRCSTSCKSSMGPLVLLYNMLISNMQ